MPNSDQLNQLMHEVNSSYYHVDRLMTIVSSAHNAHGVDDAFSGAIDHHTHGRSAQRDHEPEDGKMNELEIPDDTGPDEHVNLATDNLVTVEGESKSPEALLPEEKKEDDEEDISRAVEDALA
jgi:hypothetical protein